MQKLFWIDLEMTGLDVEREHIIECAFIITDMNFDVLETYESAIYQPPEILSKMDEWNTKHHGESGLVERVKTGRPLLEVEEQVLAGIARHFAPNTLPILCGNSISQDRLFIRKYWKRLDERLHYRMLDVSSWKLIFQEKYKKNFSKKKSHRALDDIQESVAELKFYLDFIPL